MIIICINLRTVQTELRLIMGVDIFVFLCAYMFILFTDMMQKMSNCVTIQFVSLFSTVWLQ